MKVIRSPEASEETGTSLEFVAVLDCWSKNLRSIKTREIIIITTTSIVSDVTTITTLKTNLSRARHPFLLGRVGLILTLIQTGVRG